MSGGMTRKGGVLLTPSADQRSVQIVFAKVHPGVSSTLKAINLVGGGDDSDD